MRGNYLKDSKTIERDERKKLSNVRRCAKSLLQHHPTHIYYNDKSDYLPLSFIFNARVCLKIYYHTLVNLIESLENRRNK